MFLPTAPLRLSSFNTLIQIRTEPSFTREEVFFCHLTSVISFFRHFFLPIILSFLFYKVFFIHFFFLSLSYFHYKENLMWSLKWKKNIKNKFPETKNETRLDKLGFPKSELENIIFFSLFSLTVRFTIANSKVFTSNLT